MRSEGGEPILQGRLRQRCAVDRTDQSREPVQTVGKEVAKAVRKPVPEVFRTPKPARKTSSSSLYAEDGRHPHEGRKIAGEPAGNIEARRKRQQPCRINAAMCRAQPEQTAKGRGHTDRSARIAAKGEVHRPGCNRGCGARGRSTRHPVWGGCVFRCPGMRVCPDNTIGQLIHMDETDQLRTCIQDLLKRCGRLGRRRVACLPARVAVPGHPLRKLVVFLCGEGQSVQRAAIDLDR